MGHRSWLGGRSGKRFIFLWTPRENSVMVLVKIIIGFASGGQGAGAGGILH